MALPLLATMILNIDTKQKDQGIELTLSFDTPFEETIIQKRSKNSITLSLPGVKIPAPWHKSLSNPIVRQIQIVPQEEGTQTVIRTAEPVRLKALRPDDGFSLTLFLQPEKSAAKNPKHDGKFYLIWGLFVLAFLGVIWGLWRLYSIYTKGLEPPFSIKFEYPIDAKNRVVLLSYNGVDYLILTGSRNILLGRYKEGEIIAEEQFFDILHQKLPHQTPKEPSPIDEYKRKASGDL